MIQDAPRQSFAVSFQWILSHASTDELSLICASIWACWMGRNKVVMENACCDLARLSVDTIKMIVDYKEYANKVFPSSSPNSFTLDSWRPPMDGWIKVNFNAFVGADCRRGLRCCVL